MMIDQPVDADTTDPGNGELAAVFLPRLYRWRPFLRLVLIGAVIVHAGTLRWESEPLSTTMRMVYFLLTAVALVGCAAGRRRGVWSASFIYASVFSVFHLSLLLVQIINPDSVYIRRSSQVISETALDFAFGLAVLALMTFSAATMIISDGADRLVASRSETAHANEGDFENQSVGSIGALLVTAGVTGFFLLFVLRGGPAVLFSSYGQLNAIRSTLPLGWPVYAITVGLSLLAAAPAGQFRRPALIMFAFFALLALPMGFRGEVLFPAATFAAIRGRVFFPPKARYFLLGIPALLLATSFIAEARSVGLGEVLSLQASPSIEAGLGELGSSIRPALEVAGAIRYENQEYVGFTSAQDALDNVTDRIVSFGRSQSQVSKVNDIIHEGRPRNAAGLGSSPLAEGYAARGKSGVILLFAGFGLLLAWMESRVARPSTNAYLAVVLAPLLIQVRNDISILPLHLGVGFALVFLAAHLDDRKSAKHSNPSIAASAHPVDPDSTTTVAAHESRAVLGTYGATGIDDLPSSS